MPCGEHGNATGQVRDRGQGHAARQFVALRAVSKGSIVDRGDPQDALSLLVIPRSATSLRKASCEPSSPCLSAWRVCKHGDRRHTECPSPPPLPPHPNTEYARFTHPVPFQPGDGHGPTVSSRVLCITGPWGAFRESVGWQKRRCRWQAGGSTVLLPAWMLGLSCSYKTYTPENAFPPLRQAGPGAAKRLPVAALLIRVRSQLRLI